MFLRYLIAFAAGYLLGNFSTGLMIAKISAHMDIREHGSGSAGATNMLRTLGWAPSVLTLIGDCLKALIASYIGHWIAGDIGMVVGGLSSIVGHNWPVLLGFKGGKGIAASLGTVLAINPWIGLSMLLLVILIAAVTKFVSVGSMIAGAMTPVLIAIFYPDRPEFIVAGLVVCALDLFSHRANIARLIRGAENRLDFKRISEISRKKGSGDK